MQTRLAAYASLQSNASHSVQTQSKWRKYIYAVQGIFGASLVITGFLIGAQNQILARGLIGGGLVLAVQACAGAIFKNALGNLNERPLKEVVCEVVCLVAGTAFSATFCSQVLAITNLGKGLLPWQIGFWGGLLIANLNNIILCALRYD